MQVSPNWSGYAATSPDGVTLAFTSATGTWTEPTVSCSHGDAGASSAVWIGIGGFSGTVRKVQQIGTNANCDAKGRPVYFAWFEVVPYPAYTINGKIAPGDTITASVNVVAPYVVLQVKNRTGHWTVTRKITWTMPDTSSAEWIVEAPASCVRFDCAQAALANFGSVTIDRIGAVANTAPGTLANPAWNVVPVRLVPAAERGSLSPGGVAATSALLPNTATGPSSPAGASPGAISSDGSEFTVAWIATATNG